MGQVAPFILIFFTSALTVIPAAPAAPAATPALPDLSVLMQFSMTRDDDGLQKDAGVDEPTLSMDLDALRLVLGGEVLPAVSWDLRFRLDDGDDERLDYARLRWALQPDTTLVLGKAKARVYGFSQREAGPLSLVTAVGQNLSPLVFTPMVGITSTSGAGTLTLQLTRDTSLAGSPWSSTDAAGNLIQRQPAVVFEYLGAFAGFQPLLQAAAYDLGKSTVLSLGLRYENDLLVVLADHNSHTVNDKGSTSSTMEEETRHTSQVLQADFKMGGFTPFMHYSRWVRDEYVPTGGSATATNSAGVFDDHAGRLGMGLILHRIGPGFEPWFTYESTTGRFTTTGGTETDMTLSRIRIGVNGQF